MSMDWGRALGRPSQRERFAIAAVLVIGLSAVFCYPWVRALLSAYPQCDPHRPAGITRAELAGVYEADDGGRLTLDTDGTLIATSFNSGHTSTPQSGSGTWTLLPDLPGDDIHLTVGTDDMYLSIGGSRSEPWLYWPGQATGICEQKRLTRV